MKAKTMVASLALVGTLVAGLAGGASRAAHADVTIFKGECYICTALAPSIQISSMRQNDLGYPKPDGGTGLFSTFTFGVKGSAFPQGDPMHIDLIYTLPDGITTPDDAPLAAGPYTAASMDTQASYERTYPVGNGQYIHVEAGRVFAFLTSVPVCESPFVDLAFRPSFQVVATDMATGRTYATTPSDLPYTGCPTEYPVSY